jgi:autotransporter translocation and assembly factor TamB
VWRRWLVLTLVLLATLAAVALWALSGRLMEWARQRAEHELTVGFHAPAHIGSLNVSLVPLTVEVSALRVGGKAPIVALDQAKARLLAGASLQAFRPIVVLTASGFVLDVDQLPHGEPAPAGKAKTSPASPRLFPFEVRGQEINDVTVRVAIDRQTVTIHAPRATAHAGVSPLHPYLSLAVRAAGVSLQRNAQELKLADVQIEGGVRHDQLYVDKGTISGQQLSIALTNERLPPKARHRLTAELPINALAVLFEPLTKIGGLAHVEATLTGDVADPDVDADVRVTHAVFGGLEAGDVQGRVTRHGALLDAQQVHVETWGGTATASFQLRAKGTVPAHGEASWKGIDAALIGQPANASPGWSAKSEGQLRIEGQLDPLALTINGGGNLVPQVEDRAAAAASWSTQLDLSKAGLKATASATQGPSNSLRISATVAHGEALSGTVDVRLADLAKLAPLTPPRLSQGLAGSLSANASLSGTLSSPQVSGAIAGQSVSIFGGTVPSLRGDLQWSDAQLTARSLQITTNTGVAEVAGTVALNGREANDFRVKLHEFDLSPLTAAADYLGLSLPVSGGIADGTATCRGSWRAPQLQAELDFHRLWLLREPMAAVSLRATVTPPSWRGNFELTHTQGETLSIAAEGQGTQQARVTLKSTPWQLNNLRGASLHGLSGTVALHGNLEGSLQRPGGALQVDAHDVVIGHRKIGSPTLSAEGADGDWKARAALLGQALQLRATWTMAGDWPFTLGGEWTQVDVATLLTRDPSLRIETAGSLAFTGSLKAPLDLSGEIRIPTLTIIRQDYRFGAGEPIVVRGERGRFHVVSFSLAGNGSRLRVAGDFSTGGVINASVTGAGDLTLLEVLVEPIRSARGTFDLSANVARNEAGRWNLRGNARVTGAAVDVGLPVAFTDTNASLSLAGSTVQVDNLTGKAGGGKFEIGGAVDLNRGPALSWKVNEVGVTLADGLEARATGQGKVDGTWKMLKVSGDIEVVNALYDRNVQLTDLLPWFREQIAPPPSTHPATRQIQLDLRIYARDGIFIDNNFAKAEMWLNLQLAGTAEKPSLTGTIGFLNGEVTFRGRTFTITGGTIDFRNRFEINPVLNINAESDVATADTTYTVMVTVSGTAEKPRVQFTADDPSLSQNDILSLATFGKTTAQLQREGGGVSAADVFALLPTQGIQQQLGKLVGVEVFEVEAVQAQNTGSIEPRLTIGKDLTDRLRALLSSTFGVDARRIVSLEYRLTRRISLLGSWEGQTQSQAGAFGGDIKFRYEFRKLPFSLLWRDPPAQAHVR